MCVAIMMADPVVILASGVEQNLHVHSNNAQHKLIVTYVAV